MSTAFDLLQQLRQNWTQKVHEVWVHDAPGLEISDGLLDQFFQTMADSLLTNQSITIEAFIDTLYARRSEDGIPNKDFDQYAERSFIALIHTLHGALVLASTTVHHPQDTVQLIRATEPIIFRMVEYAAFREARHQHDLAAHQQQAAKQAMEMLSESRSRFIGMATQKLRTPLTLIDGYLSMVRERSIEDKEVGKWLDGISMGSGKMRKSIDELIDIAMVDNQTLAIHYSQGNVGDILKKLQNQYSPDIKSRSLKFRIHPCKEFQQTIFLDRERIEQALGFVLGNAIRVSPKGASIVLRGRELYGFLELTVQDRGPGISPENQSAIFESFVSAGSQKATAPDTVRLYEGLHLAKGILESHGGAIWVSSSGHDPRKYPGSLFHIMIPLREEPPDDLTARLLGFNEAY